jgi:DNA-directed RNA polymerase specialized sigma24 family protein
MSNPPFYDLRKNMKTNTSNSPQTTVPQPGSLHRSTTPGLQRQITNSSRRRAAKADYQSPITNDKSRHDTHASRMTHHESSDDSPPPSPSIHESNNPTIQSAPAAGLFQLLNHLDAPSRRKHPATITVLRLYCMENLSAREIAQKCHCSLGTVSNRLKLIKKQTGSDPSLLRLLYNNS